MRIVLALLAVGILVAFVRLAIRPPRVFVVEVRRGHARLARGEAPPEFVAAVGEVLQQARVSSGRVEGIRRASGVGLIFSSSIPRMCHQRLRNLWHLPR